MDRANRRNLYGLGCSERAFFEGAQANQDGVMRWGGIADPNGYAGQAHMC